MPPNESSVAPEGWRSIHLLMLGIRGGAARRQMTRLHPERRAFNLFPSWLRPYALSFLAGVQGSVHAMGTLEYNSSRPPIPIDDVTLAHLKIIIGTKLRRQESFMMTWIPEGDGVPGRLTIWMHPSIPLAIAFDDPTMVAIEPKRIESMMETLNARGELMLDQLE